MIRALILIDFINEFLHPDGKITPQGMGKFCAEYKVMQNTKLLIQKFRENKEEIIWIHLGFHENYDNCSLTSPRFSGVRSLGILKENTWSTQFIKELEYNPNEKTITKTHISPFYETNLEEYLRSRNIQELIITGVATDLAVSSITRDGHDRDFQVTIISDACGAQSKQDHDAALIGIRKLGRVMTVAELD